MFNLTDIVFALSVVVSIISIWAVIYFSIKIALHFWVRRNLGDMPSAEEIQELYARINRENNYQFDHSPTDENKHEG